jgi:hypothetical protein
MNFQPKQNPSTNSNDNGSAPDRLMELFIPTFRYEQEAQKEELT